MRAYGLKHKKTGPCVCEMCGANDKRALKKRERMAAKLAIDEYRVVAKPSRPSFSKKNIAKMMK